MIKHLFIKETDRDEYLISILISSFVLLAFSMFFSNFFGYICGLGGLAYGIAFLYFISKHENKYLKNFARALMIVLLAILIYFMLLNVKPDLIQLILGIIVISLPIVFINKKFFPVVIPLNITLPVSSSSIGSALIPIIWDLIKAHPLIALSIGIVGIYMFFKMIKDIIKIIILTVIVWAVLRFLFGLI